MSHKKSDKRHSYPVHSINQDLDPSTSKPTRAVDLSLVTVAEEQRRLDAARQRRRAAHRQSLSRRLDSVFGSRPAKRGAPEWN